MIKLGVFVEISLYIVQMIIILLPKTYIQVNIIIEAYSESNQTSKMVLLSMNFFHTRLYLRLGFQYTSILSWQKMINTKLAAII